MNRLMSNKTWIRYDTICWWQYGFVSANYHFDPFSIENQILSSPLTWIVARNNTPCVFFFVSTSSTFTKIEKRKTMLCNRGRFILVVMSITLYYLWDGNTFQIGYPSNVAFFCFLSFLKQNYYYYHQSIPLFYSSVSFVLLSFSLFLLSPRSIIFGSKESLCWACVLNCIFHFLPYLCVWLWFFFPLQMAES